MRLRESIEVAEQLRETPGEDRDMNAGSLAAPAIFANPESADFKTFTNLMMKIKNQLVLEASSVARSCIMDGYQLGLQNGAGWP